MRILVLVVGLPVAIGLSLVSMLANWRFGVRLGAEDGDALAYGVASVCADGLKIILPFAIGWAWARRRIAEWLSAACLWLVITCYSLVSALSFAAVNRAEVTERRLAVGQEVGDLRADLDAKRRERGALPSARPASAIEPEIRTAEQSPRWPATRQCADTETRDARLFCERHQRLASELAVARRADALEREIAALTAKLEAKPATGGRTVDAQLDLFNSLSGLDESAIKAALAILVCLLIELGSGLGPYVVLSLHRGLAAERAADASGRTALPIDADHVTEAAWAEARLASEPRAVVGAAELYADYRMWMESQGQANVLTVTAFGRFLSERGLDRDKAGGRIVYRGVRLAAAPRLIGST